MARMMIAWIAAGLLLAPTPSEPGPLLYLTLSLKDKNRIFVRDLKKDEIELTVDGIPQRIEHLFTEAVPTLYVILMDTGPPMSPAMRHPFYPTLLERVQNFLLEFMDRAQGKETYMLARYDADVQWLIEGSGDNVEVEQAIRKIDAMPSLVGESMYRGSAAGAALESALRRVRRRTEMRKAILMFGHTVDQKSIELVPRLEDLLSDALVDLHVVSFAPRVTSGFTFEAQQTPYFYRSLVTRTGGTLYDYAGYADRFHRQLGDYVARLQTTYTVAFRLTGLEPAERPRRVEVRVKRPTSEVDYKKELVY